MSNDSSGTSTTLGHSLAGYSGVVDAIPLQAAILCLDCQRITSSRGNCRVCGSSSVLSLARILNREAGDGDQVQMHGVL